MSTVEDEVCITHKRRIHTLSQQKTRKSSDGSSSQGGSTNGQSSKHGYSSGASTPKEENIDVSTHSNNGNPKPWVLQFFGLRCHRYRLRASTTFIAVVVAATVHARSMHESFCEERQQCHCQQLNMRHRVSGAQLLLFRHYRYRL